jgi:hypothetical protein
VFGSFRSSARSDVGETRRDRRGAVRAPRTGTALRSPSHWRSLSCFYSFLQERRLFLRVTLRYWRFGVASILLEYMHARMLMRLHLKTFVASPSRPPVSLSAVAHKRDGRDPYPALPLSPCRHESVPRRIPRRVSAHARPKGLLPPREVHYVQLALRQLVLIQAA